MIYNLFKQSKPVNYAIISTVFVIFFIWHFIHEYDFFRAFNTGFALYFERLVVLLLIISSLLVGNSIVKKNKLDAKSSYSFLLNMLLFLIFWDVFSDFSIIVANLFLLLAASNIISSESFIISKQRVFNAALFICIAAIFHFWTILFLLVVFATVLLGFQSDFKRIFVPFIAFGAVFIWYVTVSIFQYNNVESYFQTITQYELSWFHFQSPFKQILFSFNIVFIALAIASYFMHVNSMSKKVKDSYFKILLFLVLGVVMAFLSVEKTNNLLLFTFFPVSILLTKYIEKTRKDWIRSVLLITFTLLTIVSFTSFYWEGLLL